MNDTECNQDMVVRHYLEGVDQLHATIKKLNESDLDLSLSKDSWTIRQIVHHIADGDSLWDSCILAALGNSEGVFSLQWYWDIPQNVWVDRWSYATRPVTLSLELFRISRTRMVDLINHIPDAWGRSIRVKWPDEIEERISIGNAIEMQANHTLGHIKDIELICQANQLKDEASSSH